MQRILSAGKFHCFNFFFNGTILPIPPPAKLADLSILGSECERWETAADVQVL